MIVQPYAPRDRRLVLRGLVQGLAALHSRFGVERVTAARWAYGMAVRYLARPESRCTIITQPPWEAPRGFVAAEDVQGVRVVHWVYVEPSWRRTGAAKALLDEALGDAPAIVTNITPEGRELLRSTRPYEYIPQVWWGLTDLGDWKLAGSTRHHTRQFLDAAESWATERSRG